MTDDVKSRVSYDSEADVMWVHFKPEGAEYETSDEVAPGIVLDYDKQGRVIGVELHYVRELLAQGSLADAAITGG
jgi:uncharacterized protein YuzE